LTQAPNILAPSTMLTSYQNTDYMAVRIRASPSAETKRIKIAFLVDISESMNGSRLDCVKRTLHAARTLFAEGDQITMVTFGSEAHVVANNVGFADLDAFYSVVDGLRTAGGTNLSAGIEKLSEIQSGAFDALILLTDGQINQGITSVAALNAMMQVLGAAPITALGYGPDHNQVLMRDLGLRSRGSYIYIDSESVMPAAMGDLITGLRTEVLQKATLRVPAGLDCCEYGASGPAYFVGSIVPDRDYWTVFRKRGDEVVPIELVAADGFSETLAWSAVSDCHDLQEQVLRCRVSNAILTSDKNMVEALIAEIRGASAELQARPLVLNMLGQLVQVTEIMLAPPTPAGLSRMISGGAYLSTQRGLPPPGATNAFASPQQRASSSATQEIYTEYCPPPPPMPSLLQRC